VQDPPLFRLLAAPEASAQEPVRHRRRIGEFRRCGGSSRRASRPAYSGDPEARRIATPGAQPDPQRIRPTPPRSCREVGRIRADRYAAGPGDPMGRSGPPHDRNDRGSDDRICYNVTFHDSEETAWYSCSDIDSLSRVEKNGFRR